MDLQTIVLVIKDTKVGQGLQFLKDTKVGQGLQFLKDTKVGQGLQFLPRKLTDLKQHLQIGLKDLIETEHSETRNK